MDKLFGLLYRSPADPHPLPDLEHDFIAEFAVPQPIHLALESLPVRTA